MASEAIRQRADLLGTLVVTRNTGKKLGVISQLWVDIDQQEVVAISLKPNLFYGTPQPMLLSSIRQIGDVILVDDEDVIEDMDVEIYSNLINCEVITETGDLLGKVRGYKFDIDTGRLSSIIIASLGLPLIPDQVVSTYELPIEEIISSGPDRLIVIEGSEQRLVQLSVGVMERMGIGKAPWERDDDTYIAPVRVDNQLPSGVRQPVQNPIRERQPVLQENWDDDNWEASEPRQLRQQAYREEPRYEAPAYDQQRGDRYTDDEANDADSANWNEAENWSEASEPDRYKQAAYTDDQYDDDYDEDEFQEPPAVILAETEDPWAEPEPADDYKPQPVNLPEKVTEKEKQPEYEE
jgi:sporulation protein YlmC with PRC-barrel domain